MVIITCNVLLVILIVDGQKTIAVWLGDLGERNGNKTNLVYTKIQENVTKAQNA